VHRILTGLHRGCTAIADPRTQRKNAARTEVEGMNRKTTHVKRVGASVTIAIALMAPAAAHARSGAEAPPAAAARGTVAAGIEVPAAQPAERETRRGGLDRRDGSVGAAIFVGVVLIGIWGHVVVGAVFGGAAFLLGAGARFLTGKPKGGWSDWPGPSDARVEKQHGRPRRLSAGSETNLARLRAPIELAKDAELH
jgi:hypothetical protein